ncbi:polynucleotide adenylyltransferase [Erythrobacter sp. QSSC1-22B]|uniref:CCA tRNA nucleotidyltransferase n=1 Tax=Erythrobacter sp. QSSC1-22B TaxID=1860125 RepID=UPI000805790D|nr:CCA tRNA nucleotidyltransferase [Erythrobacter sp. QSSC1-22B]OBX20442.1 polynucleotide adenylyltransferase [Erythrobacter sp. QSSC1-22B]
MTRLPEAEWTRREDLAGLVAALGAENLRWVGGAVRDTLLGGTAKDIDAATTHRPEGVIELCRDAGIRTVPTGIDHGTVTALLEYGPVEVTTLRHDVSTDGRRATVAFADDWREDAARRDFTINALYAHPETLEIADYFGGLDDLVARRVRFIGDALQRIREDHLRILRYFRFQARFGDALDEQALAACRDLAGTLKELSRERVAMELLAILGLPDPGPTVELMQHCGVLAVILPEARAAERACLVALLAHERAQNAAPEAVRRLAALIPPVRALAEAVAVRLRLSRAQRARLVCAAERTPEDAADPRGLAYRESIDCARDRLLLAGKSLRELAHWEVPQFPLKGGRIIALGVAAGPEVARMMRAIERSWVAEGFPGPERIDALLEAELAAR